jgi:UDP-N-acetylglucosamine--N-acetylmuramyl-(pentapeptide) pyrophosphoryl-undecaprenol N-acetylglucosamine transferase
MQNSNKIKILLTGGHAHSTAYALIKELINLDKNLNIYWAGPKSLVEGKVVKGVEEESFIKLGVKVFHINAGRVQMKFTRFTVPALLKIPLGFFQSLLLILREKPEIVVSFGGFVGFPIVLISWFFGIPVIIHEQTSAAGRGNIYASRFAKKIAISRESSNKYFPFEKTVLIGNPIDSVIKSHIHKSKINKPPLLFITGGHTGSTVLNNIILKTLPLLLKDFKVVHQTGVSDYESAYKFKNTLTNKIKQNYVIFPIIEPEEFLNYLSKTDIVISRAGANTVSKIIAMKIPSLLIPIPKTFLNEQNKNADFAVSFGVARKIEQRDLSPENIYKEINYLLSNWQKIVDMVDHKESPDLHAAKNFAKLILNEANKT